MGLVAHQTLAARGDAMSVIALEDLQELISRAVFLRNATADDRAQEMTEGTGSLVKVMTRCLQGAVNVPDDVIDRHLDAVLRAGGSALRHYTMRSSIDAMRAAMRAATTPVPLYDSQCRELCVALGWLGGTYHQVLNEVKRLKAADLARGDAAPGSSPRTRRSWADFMRWVSEDIALQVEEGHGVWRSCSGCHELNEGHDTGPYSHTFRCALGLGCSECGGLGAVWDTTDYQSLADEQMALFEEKVPPQVPPLMEAGDVVRLVPVGQSEGGAA